MVLESYCLFSEDIGMLASNSAIFNSFHNRAEFGTILEGLRNFGGGGVLNPQPPPRYATGFKYGVNAVHTVRLQWLQALELCKLIQ